LNAKLPAPIAAKKVKISVKINTIGATRARSRAINPTSTTAKISGEGRNQKHVVDDAACAARPKGKQRKLKWLRRLEREGQLDPGPVR
jgi:hypothetical protein